MNSEEKQTVAMAAKENQTNDYGEVQKRYLQELNLYHKQIKKIRKSISQNKAA